MKKTTQIILLLIISGNLFGQSFTTLRFRKPTSVNSTTWRFSNVTSGVDAMVTVIGNKNATLNRIDDSSRYAFAWNPQIRVTNNAGSNDSSYVHFRIKFVKSSDGSDHTISNMALTAVDLDGSGSNSYREMVITSLPATPKGIVGSSISTFTTSNSLGLISGTSTFSNLDTSAVAAMSQINYSNVNSFTFKAGVLGAVSNGTTRDFSFYFKPFASMLFVLPVKLIDFSVISNNEVPVVSWATTSEDNANRFEVYRSLDGVNYTLAGVVNANGNTEMLTNYSFTDNALNGQLYQNAFYKLRIVDNDAAYAWSKTIQLGVIAEGTQTIVASVYPNPTAGLLNISFKSVSDNEAQVEVVDAFGKVHRSVSSNDFGGQFTISLDLSDLNTGIYFVRVIECGVNSSIVKFVKH